MSLRSNHLSYLKERGAKPERLKDRYATSGNDLCILYCDPQGKPYKDSRGNPYRVRRLFPTSKPKFKAPPASGSAPISALLCQRVTSITSTFHWC